jgi:diguanylate cyclase (GGDEF)-like protein
VKDFFYISGYCRKLLLIAILCLDGVYVLFPETIRVGVNNHTAEQNTPNLNSGKSYDSMFLEQLSAQTGWTYKLYSADFNTFPHLLENGSIDMFLGLPYSTEQAKKYFYIKPAYFVTCNLLIATFENADFFAGDIRELDNAVVGILENEPYMTNELQNFAAENSLHLHLKYYRTAADLENDFTAGRLDLKFVSVTRLQSHEKIIRNFGPNPLYIVTSGNDRRLHQKLQTAVTDILRNQIFTISYWQMQVSDYSLLSIPNITPAEHDFIRKARPVDISGPLELDRLIDSMHLISGLDFRYQPESQRHTGNTEVSLRLVPLPEHQDPVLIPNYTIPVFRTVQWVIPGPGITPEELQNAGIRDKISGRIKIAIMTKMSDVIPYYRDKLKPFEPVYYNSFSECLDAVSDGKCEATVIPDYLLGSSYNLSDYPDLGNSLPLRYVVPYHLCVSGNQYGEFVTILDKTIRQLPEDLYDNQVHEIAKMFPYHPGRSAIRERQWQLVEITLFIALFSYIVYRIRKNYYIRKWAFTDDLTELWNSRRFEQEADRLLRRNRNVNYAVIESDIRGFKYINKVYGAAYGDKVLKFYAESLKKYQPSDTFIARGYADRFYILFPVESQTDCNYKCTQLFTWCNAEAASHGFHYVIKDGVALTGRDFGYDTVQNLIGKAGYAKYTIKQDLVNSVAVFDDTMRRQMGFDQQIESCMDRAFDNEEFFVMYQPKIDLKTGKITGAEALVRWNSPENGLLPPDDFMPVLEKNGYIIKLDFYVYRKVFEYVQRMLDKGVLMVPVSVNMSRFHLNAPDFIYNFKTLFSLYRIPSSFIEIEVIERATGQNDTLLINVTKQLQKAGFRVAMDDFGSGESSLNMLHTIPVDVLKMDRNFLYRAEDSPESKIIITKVMEMAKELGKETVCEGVETLPQIEFLKSIGCDMAQGFYYSKPLSALDFKQYLEQHRQ